MKKVPSRERSHIPPLEEENIFNRLGGKGYVGSLAGRSSRRKNDTWKKDVVFVSETLLESCKTSPLKKSKLSWNKCLNRCTYMDFSHWKFHAADAYEQRQQNAPQALTLIPLEVGSSPFIKHGWLYNWWLNQPIWKTVVELDHFPKSGWKWKMFETTETLISWLSYSPHRSKITK